MSDVNFVVLSGLVSEAPWDDDRNDAVKLRVRCVAEDHRGLELPNEIPVHVVGGRRRELMEARPRDRLSVQGRLRFFRYETEAGARRFLAFVEAEPRAIVLHRRSP